MRTFDKYFATFMDMKKTEIINEGIAWGVWANVESNKVALMKWKKVLLARHLADRLERLENRGY